MSIFKGCRTTLKKGVCGMCVCVFGKKAMLLKRNTASQKKCLMFCRGDGRVACTAVSRLLRCKYVRFLLDCVHLYWFLPYHPINLDDNIIHKMTLILKQENAVF